MDTATLLSFLQESIYLIAVFGVFQLYAMARGKQSVINLILALYLALLLAIQFPYYDLFGGGAGTQTTAMLIVFLGFTILSTYLFGHLMPREFDETAFQGLGKKTLFAIAGTILVMAYSFHVLPVTEFLTPGTPIQALFAPEGWFFFWLIAPIFILFLL